MQKVVDSKIFPDLQLEISLWNRGISIVAGIDEAGRGPWAGPVTAGAVVIRSEDQIVEGVRDSKKMTAKMREDAYTQILESSSGWGVGVVSPAEIDRIGIQKAVQQAMQLALKQAEEKAGSKAEYLIVDGKGVLLLPGYTMKTMNKGDQLHYSIAAASVIAKVYRDNLMKQYATKYPEYGFERHMGYGTAAHSDALRKYGPCEIHRVSYKPVAALV